MENPYYRTFIGLPLQVGQPFLDAREDLLAFLGAERISWTKPAQYHVTLRFIGDTKGDAIKPIALALREGITLPKQTRLRTTGLGSFGPRHRPRVLWVGFENSSFFDGLKQDVDSALESCGISGEAQAFRPHLTIGRVRSLRNPDSYYSTVESLHQHFKSSVLFERLVFYRSILGPKGPEYQSLEDFIFPE